MSLVFGKGYIESNFDLLYFLQYPWQNESLDKDVEFVQSILNKARSLRSDYNLTKQTAECRYPGQCLSGP